MPLLIKVVYMLHRILLTRPSAVNQKKRNRFSLSGLRFHLCLKTVHINMDIELVYKSLNLKTNLVGMAVDHCSCCINIKLHVETYCVYIFFFFAERCPDSCSIILNRMSIFLWKTGRHSNVIAAVQVPFCNKYNVIKTCFPTCNFMFMQHNSHSNKVSLSV